jgi:hypothetical protein
VTLLLLLLHHYVGFQILNGFTLSNVHLLLDFCPGMGGKVLETSMLIPHILHSLLKLSLLSRISNWPILQVNIVGHLLKVSKFGKLCELRGKRDPDIRYCLCIQILKATIVSLEPVGSASILWFHSLTRLVLKNG